MLIWGLWGNAPFLINSRTSLTVSVKKAVCLQVLVIGKLSLMIHLFHETWYLMGPFCPVSNMLIHCLVIVTTCMEIPWHPCTINPSKQNYDNVHIQFPSFNFAPGYGTFIWTSYHTGQCRWLTEGSLSLLG